MISFFHSTPSVSPEEAYRRVTADANAIILDVREGAERVGEHIPNSLHIPLGELSGRCEELRPYSAIYIHCRSGGRSARAVDFLLGEGCKEVWNIQGGIIAWERAGLPIE